MASCCAGLGVCEEDQRVGQQYPDKGVLFSAVSFNTKGPIDFPTRHLDNLIQSGPQPAPRQEALKVGNPTDVPFKHHPKTPRTCAQPKAKTEGQRGLQSRMHDDG